MWPREVWFFWARFLFQLSVPTVGKPRVDQFFVERAKQEEPDNQQHLLYKKMADDLTQHQNR